MSKFTISEFNATPKMLFKQEIDVILKVVDSVLESFKDYPTKGTLILDGQAKDQDARCIVRLNLSDGIYRKRFFGCLYDRSSDDIAADAINNALRWPEESRYRLAEERALHFGWLPSGIYKDEELEVLVLNTTHGRFLASFCADFHKGTVMPHGETTSLLVAIAAAIAKMGKEDTTLQCSIASIREKTSEYEIDALHVVDRLFATCEATCLKAWKEWHEPANNSGELTLFFE